MVQPRFKAKLNASLFFTPQLTPDFQQHRCAVVAICAQDYSKRGAIQQMPALMWEQTTWVHLAGRFSSLQAAQDLPGRAQNRCALPEGRLP